jgi:hypothetical protein
MLELAGLAVPAGLDGVSLAGSLRTGAELRRPVFASLDRKMSLRAVIEGRFKYLQNTLHPDRGRLFDLLRDPTERRDFSEVNPSLAQRLRALLEERARADEEGAYQSKSRPVPEETLEKLRALGYVDD